MRFHDDWVFQSPFAHVFPVPPLFRKVCIMFSLFSRPSRSRSTIQTRKARPWLESLEDRAVPSCSSPVIENLYAVQTNSQQVDIKGIMCDPTGGGDTILLSSANGLNTSCQVNSDGTFDCPVQGGTLGKLGAISATAMNNNNLVQSAQVNFAPTPDAPVITDFYAEYGYGNVWTFSGNVQSNTPNQTTVQFGNLRSLQGKSVQCDSDGDFDFTVTMSGTYADIGFATAQATDANGNTSEVASYYVTIPYSCS
jgi:hypothetical protein